MVVFQIVERLKAGGAELGERRREYCVLLQ